MTFILGLFTALANIKAIAGYVEAFAMAVTQWWVARQTTQTLSLIADAAALEAHAKTTEDRFKAADAWQKVFARGRASS